VSALVTALALALAVTPVALAQPTLSGPSVTLDRSVATLGDTIVLQIAGFRTTIVTVSLCGNEGRRGSADCNMVASKGLKLAGDGSPLASEFGVARPPSPCPCIVRVSSTLNDEIAVAPITINGVPTSSPVDPPVLADALAVTVSASGTGHGMLDRLRSDLGGPATYSVKVRVTNRSTVTLHHVVLSLSMGRGSSDSAVAVPIGDPGVIEPGQTWQQVVPARVAAPSFGEMHWHATASGAGPAVSADSSSRHRPTLLIVVVVVLVVDLFVLLTRWRLRRWRRRSEVDAAASVPPSVIDVAGREAVIA
jgi:hypothetical protein